MAGLPTEEGGSLLAIERSSKLLRVVRQKMRRQPLRLAFWPVPFFTLCSHSFFCHCSMRFLVSLLLVVGILATVAPSWAFLLQQSEYELLFARFVAEHGKQYASSEERALRLAVFRKNMDFILQENSSGRNTYVLSMNKLGDRTAEEIRALLSDGTATYRRQPTSFVPLQRQPPRAALDRLPSAVDWQAAGKVTPVKAQGECGADWAFAATGAVESAWAIAKGRLVPLSEQQLMDCAPGGECDRGVGSVVGAFEEIIKLGGIESEASYSYNGTCQKCVFQRKDIAATISGYELVGPKDDMAMTAALAQQPVAVFISAGTPAFLFYSSGVLDDPSCPNDVASLDHYILAVGYGIDEKTQQPFYRVKNSWSTDWGEEGYARFARGARLNQCGILDSASYPVV